ncbi:hypothetical protein VBD025_05580 [Virgibacillus flavescens]|uniref:hypothetical protein n=1 Tax=Virgibacillus flavescens TaxID=1611422 RepID=UPI003D3377E0
MKRGFFHVLEDTRVKLGRQLQKNEIEFLRWMYDRYQDEQQKTIECLEMKSIN